MSALRHWQAPLLISALALPALSSASNISLWLNVSTASTTSSSLISSTSISLSLSSSSATSLVSSSSSASSSTLAAGHGLWSNSSSSGRGDGVSTSPSRSIRSSTTLSGGYGLSSNKAISRTKTRSSSTNHTCTKRAAESYSCQYGATATLLYFLSSPIVVPTVTVSWGFTAGNNDSWSITIIDSSLAAAATAAVPPAQKSGSGKVAYVDQAEIVFGTTEDACEPGVAQALEMYAVGTHTCSIES